VSSSSPSAEPPAPDNEAPVVAGAFRRTQDSEPAVAAEPAPAAAEPGRRSETLVEVVVRLSNGDTALVGRFTDMEEAKASALALVHGLCRGDAGDWPFIGGRYLRPGAVISVDVVESDAPKWVGSADRAATWGRRQAGDTSPG
jgi:hypothetical protein